MRPQQIRANYLSLEQGKLEESTVLYSPDSVAKLSYCRRTDDGDPYWQAMFPMGSELGYVQAQAQKPFVGRTLTASIEREDDWHVLVWNDNECVLDERLADYGDCRMVAIGKLRSIASA